MNIIILHFGTYIIIQNGVFWYVLFCLLFMWTDVVCTYYVFSVGKRAYMKKILYCYLYVACYQSFYESQMLIFV